MKYSEIIAEALNQYDNETFMCNAVGKVCGGAWDLTRIIQDSMVGERPYYSTLHCFLFETNPEYKQAAVQACDKPTWQGVRGESMKAMVYEKCYAMRVQHWKDLIAKLQAEGK